MKLFKQRNKLLQLDQLIRHKVATSPTELIVRLDLPEATFYRYLDILRCLASEQGVEICYDKTLKSYYYSKNVKLQFQFVDC